MGYFDALASGAFKIGQDGRRLFFPWGVLGGGYVLASEQDYERLRRRVKIYIVVSLVLIIGASILHAYLVTAALVILLSVFYFIWTRIIVRGLEPAAERLSWNESMTTQAVTHGPAVLWALEIVSLVFVAAGVFLLVVEPADWFIPLAATAFFGLCAIAFARMLILRGRASG
jgi:hypothetical protein